MYIQHSLFVFEIHVCITFTIRGGGTQTTKFEWYKGDIMKIQIKVKGMKQWVIFVVTKEIRERIREIQANVKRCAWHGLYIYVI